MSSPAPLLKIPTPGANRKQAPRLKLGIPGSPKLNIANSNGAGTNPAPDVPQLSQPIPARPAPPQLRLATPKGSKGTPQEVSSLNNGRPSMHIVTGASATSYNGDYGNRSRSGSFNTYDGRVSGPTSATSSNYSALSFAIGLRQPPGGTPDPTSAISSVYSDRGDGGLSVERDNSMNGLLPDLEKLSLEKGRPLDVEDLDDEGWLAASSQKKIIELDSLGEGAGGAVTRCMLKGGKTVFALKIITTDPNPDVKKQIVRELNFNKDCASEHICRYYGAFMDKSTSTISIVMEFCEGGSLDSVYREVKKLGGRTGEKVLGKVAEGVLNGLTYLHGRKIIHRDIKPF
ncbi:hypothetical protein HCAG_00181 [Histoplasma mississippiense (nom. inval.)]|uniref:hypothetical protein n=1 Tax=Ajellomyces capsulatus (strain NAm1 / WU24) TaxID=2059318 RepID=UPI000157B42E|nr:hypothetical protein HCAG_00181 [Histoplasma mississippiense (nom. inval.)]EDN02317.1 hypothetical protein HCAG_00181 [Histoplasma mississippiense (nom. inval.)]